MNGKLTAEQVREVVEEHTHDFGNDWQAMANELNATLGSGTCKDVAIEGEWFECSECGTVKQLIHPNYCPNCGKAVKR